MRLGQTRATPRQNLVKNVTRTRFDRPFLTPPKQDSVTAANQCTAASQYTPRIGAKRPRNGSSLNPGFLPNPPMQG